MHEVTHEAGSTYTGTYTRRVLTAVALAAAGVVLLLFLWYARSVVLLAFAGVLLAVFLRTVAAWITAHTRIPTGLAVGVVVVLVVAPIVAAFWWRGPAIAQEFAQLRERVPAAADAVRQRLEATAVGRSVVQRLPGGAGGGGNAPGAQPPAGVSARAVVAQVGGLAFGLVDVAVSLIVLLVVGLGLAVQPAPYVSGLVRLVPLGGRDQARRLLEELRYTLARWLVGTGVAMLIMGVTTGVGLALLHVPLAFSLGLIAGLFEFVQYVGPVASGIPALLLAFTQGPEHALYVLALFAGLHVFEGYVLQPYIAYRTVWLPPALTILAQVTLGLFGGIVGVAVAAPLTAVATVLVRRLYVERALGDRAVEAPAAASAGGGRAGVGA